MRLIWKNAKTYNQPGTWLYIVADNFHNETEKQWNLLVLKEKDDVEIMKEIQQERNKDRLESSKKEDEILFKKENLKRGSHKKKEEYIKQYSFSDMEILFKKIQQLNPEQLEKIPQILNVTTTGSNYELNLEEMNHHELYKVEQYCDSILN